MESSDPDSESINESEDSVASFEDDFDIEVEDEDDEDERYLYASHCESTEDLMAYADEPLADEEWLKKYEAENEENKRLEQELQARLDGAVQVETWCSCGNCSRAALHNINECYCCQELDGCKEAMCSDIVVQDIPDGTVLKCVIQHPGFNAVCLEKWSLRMAVERLKTRDKKRYRQTGSEESYLRSIAYREFCRLVYGFLGKRRIPLPACAYTSIRKQFPLGADENYTGFELEDD
ncbi:uncharacterized protein LOC114951365 [Acropora millepora]|uniref:uncharacterized protein LOC114951365 n=1 Tax=Acropora millepora TaxID=45264 RepID=UPI001CF47525|nr:uncharacterized protein LOC114951365 [Acropora millepora]